MDFKDIQSAWEKDNDKNVELPKNLDKIQSANTPLDKIKSNLKKELWLQVFAILVLGFVPAVYRYENTLTHIYYLLYSLFTGICIYYLTKLYIFLKRLNTVTLNTRDNLYETYYDVRLNMELYKTFGFALSPFLILFLLGYYYNNVFGLTILDIEQLSELHITILFVVVAVTILLTGVLLEWWVHFFYGKYAKEIKAVIDDLKE
ncbi:hypothetical protein NBRC110019_19780 [Neptunitalea chrysea]|uniref:DUF3278 domain-containing protein n=1 Tax=Neptunitalea chrysea TaxID=1647581 RepID=A0A9W6B5C5_9FLAO|nr:hypothetical protein [Neptunitalea chrysea]GLB52938.1 hypothetical protein NBRC110019_19780 [Neptunitalea chrysea]